MWVSIASDAVYAAALQCAAGSPGDSRGCCRFGSVAVHGPSGSAVCDGRYMYDGVTRGQLRRR
eukprot:6816856-Prymnesium_polylepis.1